MSGSPGRSSSAITLNLISRAAIRVSRSANSRSIGLRRGLPAILTDRHDLELDEPRLAIRIRRGECVHAPIDRAGKACGQWMRGDVVGLMPRFGIGGGECLDLVSIRFAVRPGMCAARKASIWSSVLATWTGTLCEKMSERWPSLPSRNVKPRRRFASQFRIASVEREARQHARWPGEAAGCGDVPGLIRGRIGAADASARGKARARPRRQAGGRFQGADDGGGRGDFRQNGTLIWIADVLLLAQVESAVFPEPTMPCPIRRQSRRVQFMIGILLLPKCRC